MSFLSPVNQCDANQTPVGSCTQNRVSRASIHRQANISNLSSDRNPRSSFLLQKKKPYDNLVITRIKDSDVPDDLDQHQSADRAKRSTLFACCRLTHGKAQQVHLDALRWLQLGV